MNVPEFKPSQPHRFQPNQSNGQGQQTVYYQKNSHQQGQQNGYPNTNGYQNGYVQGGYSGGYNGQRVYNAQRPSQQNSYEQSSGYNGGAPHSPPQQGYQNGGYNQTRNFNNGAHNPSTRSSNVASGNGYQGQRYSRQPNFGDNNGMYSVPPPFMVPSNSEAGVQSIINHKFFQPSRPPPQTNPCAYQNGYTYPQQMPPYTYNMQAVQQ